MAEKIKIVKEKLPKMDGLYRTVIQSKTICLVRQQGNWYAIEDGCPHAKASLSEGKLNAMNEVICPLHDYRFNLKTGEEGENRCRAAEIFPIENNADGMFIWV